MASSEGHTELLTGWSCIVHHPSEDPEPSELISTVDITAFSDGPHVEPAAIGGAQRSSDSDTESESGTHASGSGSGTQSDSSDSDTSTTTSTRSRSPSPEPEFSVTSQSAGLRMTIATVRKVEANCSGTEREGGNEAASGCHNGERSSRNNSRSRSKEKQFSSSETSSDSVSDVASERKSTKNVKCVNAAANGAPEKEKLVPVKAAALVRRGTVAPEKKGDRRQTVRKVIKDVKETSPRLLRGRVRVKRKKMASLPLSRSSTRSSSDSQDSDGDSAMLSSCSLQEIRQEDLAAILPDQQDCDAFDAFEETEKNSPQTGDASGSDIELPQQAVNAIIQRTTESYSESETHPPATSSVFANSLIQQSHPVNANQECKQTHAKCKESTGEKKKRGRPKKITKAKVKCNQSPEKLEYCGDPNVSPDSGIQNSPDHVSSPDCSPLPQTKSKYNGVDKNKPKVINKEPPVSKLTVTSNRFDRILYGHSDRVLYPPRRKVGRPVSKKGPGRPPKNKSPSENKPKVKITASKTNKEVQRTGANTNVHQAEEARKTKEKAPLLNDICERVSKRLEDKPLQMSPVKSSPKILGTTASKPASKGNVKTETLGHCKHKHKRMKKCRLRMLKQISGSQIDPKLNSEVDKLATDFMKHCCISPVKPAKDPLLESGKGLKKMSKKRKATEYSDRKKKKVVEETTSPNEQRLPLKKRHYHLSTNNLANESKEDIKDIGVIDKKMCVKLKTENSMDEDSFDDVEENFDSSNNNEYDSLKKAHIAEAIEACISKYTENGKLSNEGKDKPETCLQIDANVCAKNEEGDINVDPDKKPTTTTPKKRHRLEQMNPLTEDERERNELFTIVNEMKMKRHLKDRKEDAKGNSIDAITRKKNKLDELTSNLSFKLETADGKRKKELNDDAGDAKYLFCKKAKSIDQDNLDVAVFSKPTGIFTPTVDLETLIPLHAIKDNREIRSSMISRSDLPDDLHRIAAPAFVSKVNVKEVKRKVRKRRAINRTGFPTVKKKKKKMIPMVVAVVSTNSCDRVPKDGEEYESFVERTITAEPSKQVDIPPDDDISSVKWEVASECDSLPLEDRIDFDLEISVKYEQASNNSRDDSPMTCSSLEDISLQERICKLRKPKFEQKLKLIRELSPASSNAGQESSASGDDIKRSKRPPRWRKKFLPAGLFSDYFKEDNSRRGELPKKLQYVAEEHPYGLLPAPYHCGRYLRCRKLPFQLPYDLWWQHTQSHLPGRDLVPSWNYRKIRTNVYNVKNTLNACEPQACNCTPVSGCGDDCINRLVFAECPVFHKCNNQRIQKHEWAPGLERFMTNNKGWGVRTNEEIKNGEFILEYVGEVVADHEFKDRMATRYAHDTHHYCLHLDGGLVIDGHRMGGDGRFVNHSCEPNCEIQKWSVNGQFRMVLFSLRHINAGEELTYDYNFSLFNPADGQECKCGSNQCRGVIGGKTQRVRQIPNATISTNTARVGRPRKTQARKAASNGTKPINPAISQSAPVALVPLIKISTTQQIFIKEHHCFLLRNIKKIKRFRDRSASSSNSSAPIGTAIIQQQNAFWSQLNALRQPRNMVTRRVAQAEDDPELKKTVRLANLLRDIYNIVIEAKDENNEKFSAPFALCPNKRKLPEYYLKVTDPIDFTTIEQNITSGSYKTVESFDSDMNKIFVNAVKFYGRSDDIGIASTKLKKIYAEAKAERQKEFESVLGMKPPAKFISSRKKADEEDIIRCICGMFRDEGLMIQCERCLVWQHCECVKADVHAASYHCEICVPRDVDYEIELDDFTEHGHRYYMTLMRGDLQLRQGDSVYVLRDIAIPGTTKKHTYDTIGEIKYTDLDIFRIERLWKDSKTGQRFAYGHHYLRPHETYHEPTRKFFPNEVMRVPLYEAVPVELVISHCWVMDMNTYCKGRPIGAPEEHIYICDFRVDKNARLFSKVSKSKHQICCKSYAFEHFNERLKITRTYTPHDLDPMFVKHRGRKSNEVEQVKPNLQQLIIPVESTVKSFTDRKLRVNAILLKLLRKMPTKQTLDVTYLLEGGRRRKHRNEKLKGGSD